MVGGGGVGWRVKKATTTDKLSIDLYNGVKVINHSQRLELSLIYIYASLLRLLFLSYMNIELNLV